MDKKSILCICSEPLYLERFSRFVVEIQKEYQVEILKGFDELSLLTQLNPVVLLVTVRTPGEVRELTDALLGLTPMINQRCLIVMAIQSGLNERIEKILLKAGCKEVLPDRGDFKTINAKLNRHLKIAQANFTATQIAYQARATEVSANERVTFVDSIVLNQDYWVMSTKRPALRNMGRWILTAIGPSPSMGAWVPEGADHKAFSFKINPSVNSDFNNNEGRWVFHGSKPDFSFELGRWSFVGSEPKLEWVGQDGVVKATRFWLNPVTKKINIASNSEQTMGWLERIEATFDRGYRFHDDDDHELRDARELDAKLEELVRDIPLSVQQYLKEVKPHFAPASGMFTKIDLLKKLDRLLEIAGDYQDEGILWLTDRVFLTNLKVKRVDLKSRVAQVMVVPRRLNPLAPMDESLAKSPDRRIYVNLKLLETSLFFYSTRDQLKALDGVLYIPIPAFAYEVQRRGGLRLINSPQVTGLEVRKIPPEARGEWKVLDLSPGGLGLEMAEDSFVFATDQTFKIDLMIQNTRLSVVCKPKWIKPVPGVNKIRVGAEFRQMLPSSRERLELYIMERHLDRIRANFKD